MATGQNGRGDDLKNNAAAAPTGDANTNSSAPKGSERPPKKLHWYSSVPKWMYTVAITGAVLTTGVAVEVNTSFIQSKIFTAAAEGSAFTETKTSGPNSAPAAAGPYDIRLGYAQTLQIRENLTERGYVLQGETQWQERSIAGIRLFPIYNEKAQAGLRITDDQGQTLHDARFPRVVYPTFNDIPPLLIKSLAYVENRELLESHANTKNPAIEWERLAYAAKQDLTGKGGAGASTLATQTEKFRHSPGGETNGSKEEKFRQMLTASVRAYQDGSYSAAAQRIALDYINGIPLSAVPGFGEVHGFSDGMKAWFGKDPQRVNELLRKDESQMSDAEMAEKAAVYRATLSIALSVKKPSAYFLRQRAELEARVDAYLPLLAKEGIISERLAAATLATRVTYADPQVVRSEHTPPPNPQKAATALQIDLLRALEMKSLYELNRLDMTARTTLDVQVDRAISQKLRSLSDPAVAEQYGLTGFRLLKPGQGANITYTFTLYERMPDGTNVLRVQADNFDGQFNLNEDSKLELGSTAKLRTMVSYLEAIADLHGKFKDMDAEARRNMVIHSDDRLTRFVVDHLQSETADKTLEGTLEAALNRTYSASPGERFFTGGGVHTFSNFESKENGQVFTVKEALHKSNNLAFIRIMRDVVNYTLYQKMDIDPNIYTDAQSETRREYLERFADKEGTTFLWKAWQQQRGKSTEEAADVLAGQLRVKGPLQLAVVHRSIYPNGTLEEMSSYIRKHCTTCAPDADFSRYYEEHAPGKFNLNDRAYLTRLHPLALWLASHRAENPDATWTQAVTASAQTRQEIYEWLFKSNSLQGQNNRIRTMLENEAFTHIHAEWKSKGFPFEKMTASYASAIGSSGDTPAALATLAGIIQNDGMLIPATKFTDIKFGENTPYSLNFKAGKAEPKRVMHAEVAKLARREMQNVVELGTARRAFGSVKLSDGTVLPLGAKTGTGDNRSHTVTARGGVISSDVKSRTATVVYTIGDRFYGAMTAYVEGPEAADYKFTSGLQTQLMKAVIAPELTPLLDRSYGITPKPAAPDAKPAQEQKPAPKVAANAPAPSQPKKTL